MGQFAIAAASVGLQMVQQRQQQKAQLRAAQHQAEVETQRLRQRQDIENRQRQEQLKRTLASQRAAFGASGVSGRGGSADAVLQGMRNETARAISDQESVLGLQIGGINDQVDNIRRSNLLQRRNFLQQTALNAAIGGLKKLPLLEQ